MFSLDTVLNDMHTYRPMNIIKTELEDAALAYSLRSNFNTLYTIENIIVVFSSLLPTNLHVKNSKNVLKRVCNRDISML